MREVGRVKVNRLMEKPGLICKQPGRYAYKQAMVERINISNHLNRKFAVGMPNQVWFGDIRILGAGSLALSARSTRPIHAPGCWLSILDTPGRAGVGMAYEQRGRPQGLLFHSDQGDQ